MNYCKCFHVLLQSQGLLMLLLRIITPPQTRTPTPVWSPVWKLKHKQQTACAPVLNCTKHTSVWKCIDCTAKHCGVTMATYLNFVPLDQKTVYLICLTQIWTIIYALPMQLLIFFCNNWRDLNNNTWIWSSLLRVGGPDFSYSELNWALLSKVTRKDYEKGRRVGDLSKSYSLGWKLGEAN